MFALKCVFLLLAIVYGFNNVCRVIKNQTVTAAQILLMAIGVVGFIATQFYI